jgi:outer membrane beta-barrel protein
MRAARLQLAWLVALIPLFVLTAPAAPAWAQDQSYREKSAYGPIQRRLFELDHEIAIGWAYLPLDPFTKGYGAQLSYTIHFNHFIALELFRVGWSYNFDSKLKTKLLDQMPDVSPAEFPAVIFFENTNLVFKLLYGKQSLLNHTVVHFEVYATLGGSFLFRNPYPVWDGDLTNARYEFGVNGGFGARFWFSPRWSIKIDLRDTVILMCFNRGDFPLKNSALIGVSFAFNI